MGTEDKTVSRKNNNVNALELKEVTSGYSYNRPVVEGINLQVPKGGFVGILGPSGSGKTTLLKIITGLHKPWYGTVEFYHYNNGGKPVIGYVPQVESVDWTFPVTVREVVSMGIWNQSGTGPMINKVAGEKIRYVLENLGIEEYMTRQISELSGGEQQRVFLARAMIRFPDILVLDEPTSGVDYNTRETILEVLANLNEKGTTIILTTHDISGIAKRLPWLVCMNKHIVSEGPPTEVLTTENLLETYGLVDTESVGR
ncbi:ABC uptake transporter, ATP-binding protein [Candidatus Nitrososphaera gargensis Ga9.2]|uniref:ABC uptake transporter, ATP-binding protein n=1 Tax=Nitrososphaera gargensis (strain Ga9.2) TaxID=1237085 RepID=K0IM71_NITGG|nr:metal ABC transporter ATP-binding protein [Candidatus Nitrososphaera gargensis]AFU57614.1 ABC uptake transporter, ATP-binding protein [Candidatus Nitrososphaera gargensis Ga9.2]